MSSASLRKKLSTVATPRLPLRIVDQTLIRECTSSSDPNRLAPGIASRLWLHLQGNTPCRSSTLLRSFVSTGSSSTLISQTDEMLEESGRENQIDCRSSLLVVGPHRGETSDCPQVLEEHPVTPMSYRRKLTEQHVPGPMITPDHGRKKAEDELLLGDECFEPLSVVTYHTNETSYS